MIKVSLSAMERNLPQLFKTYDEKYLSGDDLSTTAVSRLRESVDERTGRPFLDDEKRLANLQFQNELRQKMDDSIRLGYDLQPSQAFYDTILKDMGINAPFEEVKATHPEVIQELDKAYREHLSVRSHIKFEKNREIGTDFVKDRISKKRLNEIFEKTFEGRTPGAMVGNALGSTVFRTGEKDRYIDISLDTLRDYMKTSHGVYTDEELIALHDAVLGHELNEVKSISKNGAMVQARRISSHHHPSVLLGDVQNAYSLPDSLRRLRLHSVASDMTDAPMYYMNKDYRNNIDSVAEYMADPYDPRWKKFFKKHNRLSYYDKSMVDYYDLCKDSFLSLPTAFDKPKFFYENAIVKNIVSRTKSTPADKFGRALNNVIKKV